MMFSGSAIGRPAFGVRLFFRLDAEFRQLGAEVQDLLQAAGKLDLDDAAATDAHYAQARPVIEAVVTARARSIDALRVKAMAYVWCSGSGEAPAAATPSDRVVASIMRDLLEA